MSWLYCKLTYIYCRSFWFFKQKFVKGHKLRVNFGPLKECHKWTPVRWLSYCYEEKMLRRRSVAGLLCPCVTVLPFIWPFIFPFKNSVINLQYIYFIQTIFFYFILRPIAKIYLFWQNNFLSGIKFHTVPKLYHILNY